MHYLLCPDSSGPSADCIRRISRWTCRAEFRDNCPGDSALVILKRSYATRPAATSWTSAAWRDFQQCPDGCTSIASFAPSSSYDRRERIWQFLPDCRPPVDVWKSTPCLRTGRHWSCRCLRLVSSIADGTRNSRPSLCRRLTHAWMFTHTHTQWGSVVWNNAQLRLTNAISLPPCRSAERVP